MQVTGKRAVWLARAIGALLCAMSPPSIANAQTSDGEWRAYGHDALGLRHSPLAQIDRGNVSRLAVAWTYHTGEPLPTKDMTRSLEVPPLMIDNMRYISPPLGKVAALDP